MRRRYLLPVAPEAAPAAVAGPTIAPADDSTPEPAARVREPVRAEPEPEVQAEGAPSDPQVAAELKQAFKGGAGGGDMVDAAGRPGQRSAHRTAEGPRDDRRGQPGRAHALTRWRSAGRSAAGFVAHHPPGL